MTTSASTIASPARERDRFVRAAAAGHPPVAVDQRGPVRRAEVADRARSTGRAPPRRAAPTRPGPGPAARTRCGVDPTQLAGHVGRPPEHGPAVEDQRPALAAGPADRGRAGPSRTPPAARPPSGRPGTRRRRPASGARPGRRRPAPAGSRPHPPRPGRRTRTVSVVASCSAAVPRNVARNGWVSPRRRDGRGRSGLPRRGPRTSPKPTAATTPARSGSTGPAPDPSGPARPQPDLQGRHVGQRPVDAGLGAAVRRAPRPRRGRASRHRRATTRRGPASRTATKATGGSAGPSSRSAGPSSTSAIRSVSTVSRSGAASSRSQARPTSGCPGSTSSSSAQPPLRRNVPPVPTVRRGAQDRQTSTSAARRKIYPAGRSGTGPPGAAGGVSPCRPRRGAGRPARC